MFETISFLIENAISLFNEQYYLHVITMDMLCVFFLYYSLHENHNATLIGEKQTIRLSSNENIKKTI